MLEVKRRQKGVRKREMERQEELWVEGDGKG